jgi:hypothetical protein
MLKKVSAADVVADLLDLSQSENIKRETGGHTKSSLLKKA